MTWSYQYTPHIWPVLTSIILLAALGIYSFRHRTAPGAVPLSILMLLAVLWALANGLEMTGTDTATRIFWFKFQFALMLPMGTAALCFALEYAGLGKWLSIRTLALLVILPLAFIPLIAAEETHQFVWTRIWFDGGICFEEGPAYWVNAGYGLFLSVLHLIVLGWLFMRSPRHRWIATGLILSALITRGAAFSEIAGGNPVEPLHPMVLVVNLAMIPYALAIVRFHMFEVVPVARDIAIECMTDGLMVLDTENHIADVNKTLRTLLGMPRSKVIGRKAAEIFKAYPDLLDLLRNSWEAECEMSFGERNAGCYQASISPTVDGRGFQLGRLIIFHNITGKKRVQAKLLDQERALAMLNEREMLARELHDGIGQLASAAHLQAKCASEFLTRGNMTLLETYLNNLADITQEIKKSVRDYLMGVKTGSSAEQSFLMRMRQYIDQYSQKYGIHAELVAPAEFDGYAIDSTIEANLQPIIHEALTNARKHSGARSVRVVFALGESQLQVTVEDDGQGFQQEAAKKSQGFGLRSMGGRVEALGGHLEITSTLGKGTLVSIQVPWRKDAT